MMNVDTNNLLENCMTHWGNHVQVCSCKILVAMSWCMFEQLIIQTDYISLLNKKGEAILHSVSSIYLYKVENKNR